MLSIEIDMGCDKEMNSISKLLLFSFSIAVISTSCLAPRESSPVNSYDLGKATQTGIKLNISTIDQSGPYNNKMLYRLSSERIQINEFERWTQSPDLILHNYLKKSFKPGGDISLEGEILSFENDLTSNQAIFIFHYKINKSGILVEEDIYEAKSDSSESPNEYAAATAKLVQNFVSHISEKINKHQN